MTKKKAFTLIELMVVITVIAIITGVSVLGLQSIRQRSQDTARLAGIRDLQIAIEAYKVNTGKYPASADNLVPVYLSKLPLDTGQTNYTSANGFKYTVATDFKSYCVGVKNNVFKNSTQSELKDGTNSWKACKGSSPPAW